MPKIRINHSDDEGHSDNDFEIDESALALLSSQQYQQQSSRTDFASLQQSLASYIDLNFGDGGGWGALSPTRGSSTSVSKKKKVGQDHEDSDNDADDNGGAGGAGVARVGMDAGESLLDHIAPMMWLPTQEAEEERAAAQHHQGDDKQVEEASQAPLFRLLDGETLQILTLEQEMDPLSLIPLDYEQTFHDSVFLGLLDGGSEIRTGKIGMDERILKEKSRMMLEKDDREGMLGGVGVEDINVRLEELKSKMRRLLLEIAELEVEKGNIWDAEKRR
jgi:hypothetical protein